MPLQATSGAASYDAFGGGAAAGPTYIEDVFSTWLYTGNGSTQTITNGIDLAGKGGLVWIKSRSAATNHALYDTARGATFDLAINKTTAQTTQATGVTSFSSTGFNIGSLSTINTNNATYAAWTFRKQPKFFDVVTYTGAGTSLSNVLRTTPADMIWNGSIYVAVGYSGAEICATSTDGITWTERPSFATAWTNGSPQAIAWNGSVFCVVGDSGSCVTSPDGITWTNRVSLAVQTSYTTCNAVTWNSTHGVFVAVGSSGICAISGSGFTWTNITTLAAQVSSSDMFAIVSNGGTILCAGASGYCAISTNGGSNWTSRSTQMRAVNQNQVKALSFAAGLYVAVGGNGSCATSPDTGTWTLRASLATAVSSRQCESIIHNGSQFVVGANESYLATSTDGITWTARAQLRTVILNAQINAITWDGTKFVLGAQDAATSTDAITWTAPASNVISHSLGVAPGMIIIKRLDGTGAGLVWHRSLNGSIAINSNATDTDPINTNVPAVSPSNFSVRNALTNSTGASYVAYVFAHDTAIDSVIQCGSLTTDGSGNYSVTLGWEPQFLLIKGSSVGTDWRMLDTFRRWNNTQTTNADIQLTVNDNALTNPTTDTVTTGGYPTATGFSGVGEVMPNNGTYFYVAIRRGPMKVPTTGTSVLNLVTRSGTAAIATVSGLTARPDLVVSKARSTTNSTGWYDRLRGINRYLASAFTSSETDNSSPTSNNSITAFNNNSYSLGADQFNTAINNSDTTYVNWVFQRAPGFFDEVCYTGTGANRTVAHNLGAVPEIMIVKMRSGVEDWGVYTAATGNTGSLRLNTTGTLIVQSVVWNNTSPTASVFSVGSNSMVNANGSTYVAYLFASCPGVSKVGNYTGNGSSQTINCGFTGGARFVMIKRTDSTGDWYVWDTARGIVAGNDPHLSLNTTAAEVTSNDTIDTDSTGFVVNQVAATNVNVNAATYIFLAIA
jgi:hypothetical protein